MHKGDLPIDPRGLIFEAYRMAIGPSECRSIFLDWALGLPDGAGRSEIRALLDRYGAAHPDHPIDAEAADRGDATTPIAAASRIEAKSVAQPRTIQPPPSTRLPSGA